MRIISVVGARPNFIKIAPISAALAHLPDVDHCLVHTGQHYDRSMSEVFFQDLSIPLPDIDLEVGSASHAVQTARIMEEFEKVCLSKKPDIVMVVGDVNSTVACALVAAKHLIPVAHVEAGLRSFDRTMPEEINRIVTDTLSDYLFTTCRDANQNLQREGISDERIHFVGNVMIDTLLDHREKAKSLDTLSKLNVEGGSYVVMTLHRPSNVDDATVLRDILQSSQQISTFLPVVFPVHPRTSERIREFGLDSIFQDTIRRCPPLGYMDFLNLVSKARFVMTDSGGLQEETTILNIPCLTIRENTERPVTITEGTNQLVGTDPNRILKAAQNILDRKFKETRIPELWDGKTSERIINILTR